MTTPRRCPHCGSELTPDTTATPGAASTDTWESLQSRTTTPGSIAAMIAEPGEGGPTWWLPSLAYLAYQVTTRPDARAVLDEFASRRDELHYAVVEEETDDVVGLSIQPWPRLDERGRLRFPISADPLQLDVSAAALYKYLRAARRAWCDLGLLEEELVERSLQIGDAYALTVAVRGSKSRLKALPGHDQRQYHLGGLPARRHAGSISVPVLDVTWDAREAGKLAHYAAAAGVITEDAQAPDAAVAEETEARYMVGYRDGIDPRDIPAGTERTS